MSILDSIKKAAKEQGGDRAKIMYWKDGDKKRIRFINDMEDGVEVMFHNSFKDNINALCLKQVGKECPYCGDERVKDKKLFAWSVWDYEAEEVKIFMFVASSKCSPILNLASMYEDYGTLMDRDYNIKREGKQLNTNYSVIPMDKKKFIESAKPYTKKSLFAILEKAYPADETEKEEKMKDEDLPFRESKGEAAVKAGDTKDFEEVNIDDFEEIKPDYSEMSAKQLYKLCKESGIIVEERKSAKYYIEQLEKWEMSNEDWGEDE